MRRMWAALAAIGWFLLVVPAVVVAQDPSPSAAPEPMRTVTLDTVIPDGAMPAGLEKVVADALTLDPSASISIPFTTEPIRGRLCLVQAGALQVTAPVDTSLWEPGATVKDPVPVMAGEAMALVAASAFLVPAVEESAVDAATSVELGVGPDGAVIFCLHLHQPGGQFGGWPAGVTSTQGVEHSVQSDIQATDGAGTRIRISTIVADPGSVLGLPEGAAYAIEVLESGSMLSSQPGAPVTAGGGRVLSAAVHPARTVIIRGTAPAVVTEVAVFPEAPAK